jgi:hypothetical protein
VDIEADARDFLDDDTMNTSCEDGQNRFRACEKNKNASLSFVFFCSEKIDFQAIDIPNDAEKRRKTQ